MLEDDFYRESTQYRHWSFTPAQLAEQRALTNSYASDRVRVAFERARGNESAKPHDGDDTDQVETLTVDEEQKIVEWGSNNIIELGKRLNTPTSCVATAIQYLRRFYLMNSPMTYHPKAIQVCALWLAVKSCHVPPSMTQFTNEADLTEDELKSPEFLLLQGNKFTLDVRHPFKGLHGGLVEIRDAINNGELDIGDKDAEARINTAADKATSLIKFEAQMTDVYFLYTPAQIWLAALHLADAELTSAYLKFKIAALAKSFVMQSAATEAFETKLHRTIRACAAMIAAYKSPEQDKKERKEIGRIGRKLAKCQDPEKADIVAIAKAKRAEKREGSESEREGEKKKRKMEKEREKDADVFGGELRDV